MAKLSFMKQLSQAKASIRCFFLRLPANMPILREAFLASWFVSTIGLLLIGCSTIFLIGLERHYLDIELSLEEAKTKALSLDCLEEGELNYNGRVLHLTGALTVADPLTEPDYNIAVVAVKLKRYVEMLQWVEVVGDLKYGVRQTSVEKPHVTYTYLKEWHNKPIDSSRFYRGFIFSNPHAFPMRSYLKINRYAYIGFCELGPKVKDKFNSFDYLTSATRPTNKDVWMHMGQYYHSVNLFAPRVGDWRVTFSAAGHEGTVYTVIGMMTNDTVGPYRSSYGKDVLMVYKGHFRLDNVFEIEQRIHMLYNWMSRATGWLLMFFGVIFCSKLIRIILLKNRVLAILAPDQVNPCCHFFLISISLSMIIASLTWFIHRPVMATAVFFAAVSPLVWVYQQVLLSDDNRIPRVVSRRNWNFV